MKFGITQDFPCSYLEQQHERLLMVVDEGDALSSDHYETLLHNGFRRSGDQVYRPHCASCDACQSLRVPVSTFSPSKSQKRILKKNSDLTLNYKRQSNAEYFPLYAEYIEQRHADGSMYPPDQQQFENFIHSKWLPGIFIECYQGEKLVAVAVTDEVNNALSALYTFYAPELESRSIGTFAILQQIELAKKMNKSYLYLGYQIDQCAKMNYKQKFLPNERFFADKWHLLTKKCD